MRALSVGAAALLLVPGLSAAQGQEPPRTARVTYVTGSSAYIDAGSAQGLREGSPVWLLRGGVAADTLRVSFLSSRQSACSLEGVAARVAVGDTVGYRPAAPEPVVAAADSAPPIRPAPLARGGRLRGRIGARYLTVRQREGSLSRYSQPALDFRLDGSRLAGTGLGVQVDVRARRITGTRADGTQEESGRTRVYQAALSWRPGGTPFRFAAGRQFAPGGASVSLFDGLLAEASGGRWAAGAFAGTEPDPAHLALSGSVKDFGAYVELHTPPAGAVRGFVRTGAIGSYQEGVANREFVYLQGGLSARRVSVFLSQEIDYYQAWKREDGDGAVSPTSTFATLHYQPVDALALSAGFDNRRDVRLYRDLVTPETAFDDSFRHGAWAGVSLALAGRYRLSFDARSNSGGSAGTAHAYTGAVGASRLTRYNGDVRLRTTRFEGPRLSGWIHALSLAIEPAPWARLELGGGVREEHNPLETPSDLRVSWLTGDLDVSVARGWYALLSLTREQGAFESNDQVYGGLSYRF